MAHYAKVLDGKVTRVIVAEEDFFNTFIDSTPGEWIQTSYNTHLGAHRLGGTPLRKNFAGIGFTYDAQRDAFIAPKKYDSWTLNEDTCDWDPPTPKPEYENKYTWNESTQSWDSIE